MKNNGVNGSSVTFSPHSVCGRQHAGEPGVYCPSLDFPPAGITLAGIACIIMREVYATIGESIYPNPSCLSRDFPEGSGRLLRNHKEFTFQDRAN